MQPGIVDEREFTVEAGSIRPLPITVAAPDGTGASGIQPIRFLIAAKDDPATSVEEKSSFVPP